MEEERNGFSIIGFIAQVLVILLFIFVLMWLFPTKSYIEKNGGNNDSATAVLLFNQNLLSMKDAGREYFTTARMPKEEGEKVKLTLAQMLEKSMVVDFIDANGNKCDSNSSYIEVTKVGSEYSMNVVLTCSGTTKNITTTIGCYDYCADNLCEKKEQILYEYKKITDATEKWSTWSSWSKTKVVGTSTREVETKIVKEPVIVTSTVDPKVSYTYSCPSGYNLSTDKSTCTKNDDITSSVASTISCPSGYSLNSAKTACTKKNYSYVNKIEVYACKDSSYTLSGTECYKTVTTVAKPHVTFTAACSGCETEMTITYSCSDLSYKLSGTTCSKKLVGESYVADYKCPSGYSMNSAGTKCYKTTTSTTDLTYSCATNYTLSPDKKTCTTTTTTVATTDPIKKANYSCSEGVLNSSNKCDISTTSYKEVTLYRYRTLIKTEAKISIKWSALANDQTLIKNGYKKTGNTKVTTIDDCKTECSK